MNFLICIVGIFVNFDRFRYFSSAMERFRYDRCPILCWCAATVECVRNLVHRQRSFVACRVLHVEFACSSCMLFDNNWFVQVLKKPFRIVGETSWLLNFNMTPEEIVIFHNMSETLPFLDVYSQYKYDIINNLRLRFEWRRQTFIHWLMS